MRATSAGSNSNFNSISLTSTRSALVKSRTRELLCPPYGNSSSLPFRVSPGECSGPLGCRTRQSKVQLNSRTEAEIMPLCQYCDKPQITSDAFIALANSLTCWSDPGLVMDRGHFASEVKE